jgi:uncharacterized protein
VTEGDAFDWLPALLVLQGVMGALDTIVNHELIEALPRRAEARGELALHSAREAVYAALFLGLGWFAWLGAAAFLIVILLIAEIVISVNDELIENRIRVLPQNERALHIFLTLNFGALLALLAPVLADWMANPTALEPSYSGWMSWALAALGIASAGWSVRDLIASRRLKLRA